MAMLNLFLIDSIFSKILHRNKIHLLLQKKGLKGTFKKNSSRFTDKLKTNSKTELTVKHKTFYN